MKKMKALTLAGVLIVAGCSSSSGAPEWAQRNQRVIDEFKITWRALRRYSVGNEAAIFKAVLWHSIVLASLVGLIVMSYAYLSRG